MSRQIQRKRFYWLFKSCLTAIALTATVTLMPNAHAKLFDGPVDKLPVLERAALRNGQVSLQGEDGEYTGRVLVTASNFHAPSKVSKSPSTISKIIC